MVTHSYYLSDGYPATELPRLVDGSIPVSLDRSFRVRNAALIRSLAKQIGKEIPPLSADLIDVARGLFLVDCEARRPTYAQGSDWRRSIFVQIPVRDLEQWRRNEAAAALSVALEFVSGDHWQIEFVPYTGWKEDASHFLDLDLPLPQRVCLFSEGLDSLGGLVDQARRAPTERFLALSAVTQWQCRRRINQIRRHLNRQYQDRIDSVVIPLHRNAFRDRIREERSQRLRSFLLIVLGGAVAVAAGCRRLDVYENGLEAFNFAYCASLAPGRVSRAMHPSFLFHMSRFLTVLTETQFDVVAPYLFHTKADLVRELQRANNGSMIGDTVSCIHFPQRRAGVIECGVCTGCLLRKVALYDAGLAHLTDNVELRGRPERSGADLEYQGMDLLVYRLEKALRSHKPLGKVLAFSGIERRELRAFIQACAHSAQIPGNEVAPRMIALFSRYVQEWRSAQRANGSPQLKKSLPQPPIQLGWPSLPFSEQEVCLL